MPKRVSFLLRFQSKRQAHSFSRIITKQKLCGRHLGLILVNYCISFVCVFTSSDWVLFECEWLHFLRLVVGKSLKIDQKLDLHQIMLI